MDYTSDVEFVLEDHPEKVSELIGKMDSPTEREALRVLTAEISNFHHALTEVIQDSNQLNDFQKDLADSILSFVQDNEYNDKEMQRLANTMLLANAPKS